MVAIIISFGFNKCISQVTDIDGNVYKTVSIGNQEWMAENLNVEHYRNGDIIPQVQDTDDWFKLTTGAWCYYENNSENGKYYGKLYNWYAVNDSRGLAPKGWHIPCDAEWIQLTDILGGKKVAGGKLKAISMWNNPNTGATNESGFTAYPRGLRDIFGYFSLLGEFGYFWSSSENEIIFAWYCELSYEYSGVIRDYYGKNFGLNIRCVKD